MRRRFPREKQAEGFMLSFCLPATPARAGIQYQKLLIHAALFRVFAGFCFFNLAFIVKDWTHRHQFQLVSSSIAAATSSTGSPDGFTTPHSTPEMTHKGRISAGDRTTQHGAPLCFWEEAGRPDKDRGEEERQPGTIREKLITATD